MEYPNITLRIHNQLPTVELHNNASKSSTLATASHGLDTLVIAAMEKLGWNASLDNVWELVREANEVAIDFPADEDEADGVVNLGALLDAVPTDGYAYDENLSTALNDQLAENWRADIIASLIDAAYVLLVAEVLAHAGELSIENIVLDDERADPTLRERMSLLLAEIDTELVVK